MSKIVLALGGNALGNSPKEQLEAVKIAAEAIVDLIQQGHEVVIGHGNGPQVGMINLAMDYASNGEVKTPSIPLVECGAMSQGYIGYHLQQSIQTSLRKRNIDKDVATIVTQVVVDENDAAFKNPTKPVGSFYTKDEAEKIANEKGFTFVEDAGRGYRRVVPSPLPKKIVELSSVNKMVNSNMVVITVGGGGIPVIENKDTLIGVDAVIDKDRSSACLATDLKADILLILTAVEKVAINYNKPDQKNLDVISVLEAKKYCEEGHFAKGSMLPKVEACIDFLENSCNGEAIITSLEKAAFALSGLTGTKITK